MNGGAHPAFFANAEVMALRPADVHVPERIGFLHADWASALGRLMAVDGQREPIKVAARKGKPGWQLVAGLHRLEGAKIEGLDIWALEVSGDADTLRAIEGSENTDRRRLAPIERAKFTAALVEAAQKRLAKAHGNVSQQTLAIKARWAKVKAFEMSADAALDEEARDTADTMSAVYGWQESVADVLGLTPRTIRRDLELHRLLIAPFPELAEPLARHPIVGENAAQLKAICAVAEDYRRPLIEELLRFPALSVDEAKDRLRIGMRRKPAATPLAHQKYLNAVVGNLGRLTPALRARHLPEIANALGTDAVKRQMRDLLNEQLGESAS